MARAYSLDLRERLLRARTLGVRAAEIERTTGVSQSTLGRWRRVAAAGAALTPGVSSGRPPKIAPDDWPLLRAQVAARPDATLAEHCAQWRATRGVSVSAATMSRALARLGLPLKKRV